MSETVHLTALADRINEEHRGCEKAARSVIEHALAAGNLLLEAKQALPHGTWGRWLEDNVECSPRTAQVYMRIAREWPIVDAKNAAAADLTIRNALDLMGQGGKPFLDSVHTVPEARRQEQQAPPVKPGDDEDRERQFMAARNRVGDEQVERWVAQGKTVGEIGEAAFIASDDPADLIRLPDLRSGALTFMGLRASGRMQKAVEAVDQMTEEYGVPTVRRFVLSDPRVRDALETVRWWNHRMAERLSTLLPDEQADGGAT